MCVNQLLFLLEYLLDKLFVVGAQVLDIGTVLLLKLGLCLHLAIQVVHLYNLDGRPVPDNRHPWLRLLCLSVFILLVLWLLFDLRGGWLNYFLDVGRCHLRRCLRPLQQLVHPWRADFWLLTEEVLLATAARRQVRRRSHIRIPRRDLALVRRGTPSSSLHSVIIDLTARDSAICRCG